MIRRALLPFLTALALAGCAGMVPTDEANRVGVLLAEYRQLATRPVDEQARAYQEAETEFEREPGDWQRLRLALTLALPRAAWRDDTRLLRLLEAVEADTPGRDFAILLRKVIEERQSSPRDEARRTEERLQRLLAERQRQLREERRRVEELEQKVDALRSIDRDALYRQNRR